MAGSLTHKVHPEIAQRRSNVFVIGCGGNGSGVLLGLCALNQGLRGLGHPGIHVTAFDPDSVTPANFGRQLFVPSEIGQNKAIALIQRVNMAFGLNWAAVPLRFRRIQTQPQIVISCVDSKQARDSVIH
jgi:PRTRC genetic system ThiF family protein